MSTTILIADDDPVQRRLLENAVSKLGFNVRTAEDGVQALEVLKGAENSSISLVILDLVMPELDGMGVLAAMREQGLERPVIVQTSKGSIEAVVSAMRAGADDFVVKPVSPERLGVSIQNALKLVAMEDAVRKVQKSAAGTFSFDDMIGESPAMKEVIKLAMRSADSNIPVLIEGESGVGKEVMARAIQGSSERMGKPFVVVNCGALPENLAESILFGHEKGAFTGADRSHLGKFREADGGTLFLDEVGELPLDLQVKLLRAIQEGEIDPIGAKKPVKVNVRLLSATNRDLLQQVKEGHFREDLYYRLSVFPIVIPPLRNRKSDLAALVQYFCARISLEEGRSAISGVEPRAMAMLEAFDWPGNIRQLENAVFRAIVLCEGQQLTMNEFPQIAPREAVDQIENINNDAVFAMDDPNIVYCLNEKDEIRPLEDIEGDVIRAAVDHYDGRMTKVARSLSIGRSTLYRKLREMGMLDLETN